MSSNQNEYGEAVVAAACMTLLGLGLGAVIALIGLGWFLNSLFVGCGQ